MKKYIFTESQIKYIIDGVIKEENSDSSKILNLREQQEEQKQTKTIQNFLNTRLKANLKVDGIVGPSTKQAIEKYQQIIGVYPTDGVWGQDTYDKMPKNDKKIYDDYLNAQGDIIDKVLNLLR